MSATLKPELASYRLDRSLQPEAYSGVFRANRRLHLPGFLEAASAEALYRRLSEAADWTRAFHLAAGKDVDVPVEQLKALAPEERAELERSLLDSNSDGVRYVFDTIRISSELNGGRPVTAPMRALHHFVNSPEFMGFARRLTGDDRIAFADVMATRYMPGHFATAHADELPDQRRLYAYVLNMTPQWRADWGGVLMFIDEDGHVAEGLTPRFNALNIFAIPQVHSVSVVTRLARAPRLSVTGWLHAAA